MQTHLLIFIGPQPSRFRFKDQTSALLFALGIKVMCQSVSAPCCDDGTKFMRGHSVIKD